MSASEPHYPNGGGNEPGSGRRTRRRGSLPGAEDTGPAAPAPLSTAPAPLSTVPADTGDLAMTARQAVPDAKVWGLRVSEQHYDTARTMTGVLAARYRLDQRQIGELIVQFLVTRRFDLDTYISQQVGPGIDLDFFARPAEQDSTGPA